MTGLTNYTADALLNFIGGAVAFPTLPSVYLALFTGVGTGTGTGFTEVTSGAGTAYARVQVAGTTTATASAASGATTIAMATPSWVTVGMYVYDSTHTGVVSGNTTITVTGASSITISNALTAALTNGDTIVMSAFQSPTGTDPSTMTNNSVITFATPVSAWGTVIAFGLYDSASASTDLLSWDYLGNYAWLPNAVSNASPAVFTSHAHGYASGTNAVFTTEYGGTAPSLSAGSLAGLLTVSGTITTDTFNLFTSGGTEIATSSTGDGMVRGVASQVVPTNVVVSFAASALTISAA